MRTTTQMFSKHTLRKPGLTSFILQDNATRVRAGKHQKQERCDDGPICKKVSTGSTQKIRGPVPNWTLKM